MTTNAERDVFERVTLAVVDACPHLTYPDAIAIAQAALTASQEPLRRALDRMIEAVDYAHSEGFEWPSDPWLGIDRAAPTASQLQAPCAAPSLTPGGGRVTIDRNTERDVVELIALLRREGNHSGVWFAEHLLKAADLIAAPTASQEPLRRALEDVRQLAIDDHWGTPKVCVSIINRIDAALNTGDDHDQH